ncbi:MAG: gliding motility-associated C-terminal domain-containing protein [Flavobacteriales bacterium]|nr:gliding motility-associated C-terminal domain-containing protein [Flavobacteriales bacterium]
MADQSIVTVTITSSPDAGIDGAVTACDQGAAIGLFAELGGSPDAGGTWTDPNGVAHSGNFDPATDIAGNYTYSIGALAPCVADQSIVAVTITSSPDAGVDGAVTVCDQGAAIGLFAELGGTPDPGGTWTDPNGVAHSGSFDPATDIAGNYTYSIGALAPCVADQSIVAVTITSSPDAGVDGAVTVCDQGAAIGLLAELGGTPDAGGTWTDPNGVAHSGNFDPATDIVGNYTYSIGALAPCVADQSIVAVTITSSPDAGLDGAVTACDQGAAIGLFAELGGSPDAGGTWTDPNGVAHSGNFDPATDIAGNYTYSIGALAPCVADQSIVAVTITSSPDAGVDGAVTVCDQGAAIGLLAELGGTPDAGGTWTDPNGVAHSGSFDPSTDIAGNYTYSIGALAPCTGDQSTISVSLEISPNAGTDGTLSLCAGSPIADLFVQLTGSPDATGVWTDPNGVTHAGSFDAGNDPTGSYIYTVSGTLCPSDASIVVVDVLAGPDAGQDNAVAICETAAVLDLFTVLLGSPDVGGTWTDPNSDPVPAILDPQVAIPGNYTYSIPGNGACPSDEAVLAIAIAQTVNAGSPGAIMLCSSAGPTDLYSQLTGTPQPGGAWTDPFGLSVPALFDPATGSEGAYTYIVTGNAPCPDASTTVVVEVEQAPEAGDDAVSSLCSSSAAVPLSTLLNGTPGGGGTWIAPNGMPASALLEPSSAAQGTYQYIVPAVQPCVNDTAQVIITISTAANAGSDGSLALCSNAPPVGLFPQLGGTPDSGGTWTGPHGAPMNPVIDPSSALSGTYTYTVAAIAPCVNDAATVEVTITMLPDPQVAVSLSDGCVPVLAAFTTDYTGPGSFVWDLGNDSISTESAPDSILYSDAGVYDVTLLIDAGSGCVSTTVINDAVHAFVPPVASFEPLPGEVTTLDPAVYFHNLTVGANAYAWTFADLGTSEEQDPHFVFPAALEGEYEVCLVAFSAPTCADTACLPLVVRPTLLVNVPNAFTPDGDDINDTFHPVTVGVDPDQYLFQVFDRWGQPLFSTQDPLGAWNGRFLGNEEVPSGVYIWKLEAKGISTTARIERTGHVTLVR